MFLDEPECSELDEVEVKIPDPPRGSEVKRKLMNF